MESPGRVLTLPTGRFKVATIEYRCDLSRRDGLVIYFGAIAEITLSTMRGLGLIARAQLGAEELGSIGAVGARALSNPFEYLRAECETAWKTISGFGVLDHFSKQNAGSLVFGMPEQRQIPTHLLRQFAEPDVSLPLASSEIRKLLSSTLEDEVLKYIWDTQAPTLENFQKAEPLPLAA